MEEQRRLGNLQSAILGTFLPTQTLREQRDDPQRIFDSLRASGQTFDDEAGDTFANIRRALNAQNVQDALS